MTDLRTPSSIDRSGVRSRQTGSRIALFVGVAIGVWMVCTGPLLTQVEMFGDGERDLFRAWAGVYNGYETTWGPMVAGIDGVHLGTGWIQLMEWLVRLSPTATGIFKIQVAVTALSAALLFVVVWVRINPWTAVLWLLMFLLSVFFVRMIRIVWHPGFVPATACLWFVTIIMAWTTTRTRLRMWWLVSAWLVVAFLMHLHLVFLPYAGALFAMQCWLWWRGGLRKAPWASLASIALIVFVTIYFLPIVQSLLNLPEVPHYTKTETAFERLTYFVTMFGSAWMNGAEHGLRWNGLGVLVLGATGVGMVRACRRGAPPVERWIALQAVLGLAMTVAALRGGLAARYAGACGPGVCLLAGYTMASFRFRVPRTQQMLPIAAVVVILLAIVDPVQGQWIRTVYERNTPRFNIVEEERAVEAFLGEQDIHWKAMEGRFHGWVVRALSLRYVALSLGLVKPDSDVEEGVHWTLVGPGQPPPAYATKAMSFDGGAGRLLQWVTHAPRFAYEQVEFTRGGAPCRAVLPYHNLSQPRFDVLKAVDMVDVRFITNGGGDMHPCAMRLRLDLIDMAKAQERNEQLTIIVPPVVGGVPLTLMAAHPAWAGERMVATSSEGRSIPVTPYVPTQHVGGGVWNTNEYIIYQIAVRDGEAFTLSLPTAGLTGLDIY